MLQRLIIQKDFDDITFVDGAEHDLVSMMTSKAHLDIPIAMLLLMMSRNEILNLLLNPKVPITIPRDKIPTHDSLVRKNFDEKRKMLDDVHPKTDFSKKLKLDPVAYESQRFESVLISSMQLSLDIRYPSKCSTDDIPMASESPNSNETLDDEEAEIEVPELDMSEDSDN